MASRIAKAPRDFCRLTQWSVMDDDAMVARMFVRMFVRLPGLLSHPVPCTFLIGSQPGAFQHAKPNSEPWAAWPFQPFAFPPAAFQPFAAFDNKLLENWQKMMGLNADFSRSIVEETQFDWASYFVPQDPRNSTRGSGPARCR
ncbi:hypothetical protein [Cupriavidus sp. EM10]|uniref:hypothetical protein n=1 Tax=Cupriavidus sp. EM10 TaxID=2839983 RepID=UPI001BFFEDE8|nr:hypothetical protein [Cupriavidus sp. EM10]QWE96383.1 hypothetical protein KLP38_24670 [Cupriavidus sp. EM10]